MLLFARKAFSFLCVTAWLLLFPVLGIAETQTTQANPQTTPAEAISTTPVSAISTTMTDTSTAEELTKNTQEASIKSPPPPPTIPSFQDAAEGFSYPRYFKAIAVLILLIFALWCALSFLRKKGNFLALSSKKSIKNFQVESQLALGPKKALMVVNFNHEHFIIGVTDASITLLAARPIRNFEGTDDVQEDTLFTQYISEQNKQNIANPSASSSGVTE